MRLEQITAEALKYTNNNRYLLATAVAKRVEQLLNGAKPLVNREIGKIQPTNIALEEISKGLIKVTLEQ